MVQCAPMPEWLTTDRLCLRPWTVEDLCDNIRSQLLRTASTGIALMAVERREEKDYIGYCGLIGRAASPDEPELAYELLRKAHGNGYATEAAHAVRDAAAATGRSRLWAGVRVWNTASLRVLGKIGFVPSGRVEHDLERGDMILMMCRLAEAS